MKNKSLAFLISGCIGLSVTGSLAAHADYGPYTSWQEAYTKVLLDFKNTDSYFPSFSDNDTLCSMFDLKDVTNDGIPELFISEGGYHPSPVNVYTFMDGKALLLIQAGSYGLINYNNDSNHDGIYFIDFDRNQGISTYTAYVFNNDSAQLDRVFTNNEDLAENGTPTEYSINRMKVSKEDYYKAFEKYKDVRLLSSERKYKVEDFTENTSIDRFFNADPILIGDVNLDGIIDGVDASAILTAYTKSSVAGGKLGLDDRQKSAADVNFDGIIDGVDATHTLTFYAKASVGFTGTIEDSIKGRVFSDDGYTYGFESGSDALSFLEGKWGMLAGGQPIRNGDAAFYISFHDSAPSFTLTQTETKNVLSSVFELQDLFGSNRGCYDLIRSIPPSEYILSETDGENTLDYPFSTFFTAAYVDGLPVITLRSIGNGISPLHMMFNGDYGAVTNGWVFAKETDEDVNPPSEEKMAEMRVKGNTFYAFRWLDLGSDVYLQEVTTAVTREKYEDGEMRDMMFHSYKDNGHALTAVRYKIKGAEELANSGIYRPGLVKVTTDKEGNITALTELQELDYGYYTPQ